MQVSQAGGSLINPVHDGAHFIVKIIFGIEFFCLVAVALYHSSQNAHHRNREKRSFYMTTLHQLGEREVIRRLAKLLPGRDDVRVGIGDDAAVVHVEGSHKDFLLTSDSVIEGTHFLPDAPPEQIGHKAIGRVLSDFAAMGGEPLWALIDVVANRDMPIERLAGVSRRGEAGKKIRPCDRRRRYGGRARAGASCVRRRRDSKKSAILRSGARTGDVIYVTGSLGGSLQGKHLTFEPRLEEGLWLRESRWANSR